MKSFIGKLGALAAMAAMYSEMGNTSELPGKNSTKIKDVNPSLHEPIPKGCKKWYINEFGEAYTREPITTVFTCYALNEKSALRKYKNHIS